MTQATVAPAAAVPLSDSARRLLDMLSERPEQIAPFGVQVVARELGVTRRSVQRWLRELDDGGFIRREHTDEPSGRPGHQRVTVLRRLDE